MSNEQILEQITQIFRSIFKDNSIIINEAISAQDIDEWDSLNNIQIVIAVEKHFKVRFKSSEIRTWKNVGEMVNSIQIMTNGK
jgi:acyl carrier protein